MITHKIRKACVSMAVILSVMFFTSNAFPWGSATHAYIDGKIGNKLHLENLNEIYGGMAADIFNFYPEVLTFGTAYNYLYIQTHYNSLALWAAAQTATDVGKASVFGFASHANGQGQGYPPVLDPLGYRGADFTAHGLNGNNADSYVVNKATYFWEYILKPLGIISDDALGLSTSHNVIEFAIDIMVVYDMPSGRGIGKKMIESALHRSSEFPLLLVDAYADGLSSKFGMSSSDAAQMIISAERDFRKTVLIYGQGLVQTSEEDAIKYVAALLAQTAYDVYGITVDPNMAEAAIIAAQALCRDFVSVIRYTVEFVTDQMASASISY